MEASHNHAFQKQQASQDLCARPTYYPLVRWEGGVVGWLKPPKDGFRAEHRNLGATYVAAQPGVLEGALRAPSAPSHSQACQSSHNWIPSAV